MSKIKDLAIVLKTMVSFTVLIALYFFIFSQSVKERTMLDFGIIAVGFLGFVYYEFFTKIRDFEVRRSVNHIFLGTAFGCFMYTVFMNDIIYNSWSDVAVIFALFYVAYIVLFVVWFICEWLFVFVWGKFTTLEKSRNTFFGLCNILMVVFTFFATLRFYLTVV